MNEGSAGKITQTFNGQVIWNIAGGYFKLLAAAAAVSIKLYKDGACVLSADSVDAGFYQSVAFDRVEITCTVSQQVDWLFASQEGGSDRITGTITISGASTLALPGNVAVGVAEVAVLAAATRRKVIFMADKANAGTIYLGPVGVLTTTGAVPLDPGDVWEEIEGASAAWRAIATLAAQTLRVMTET